MSRADVVIVGAGIFGASAALELVERGYGVTLIDAGPIPHPLASSTDISKLIRLEYGRDVFYVELVERALEGWRALDARLGTTLFHETGVLILAGEPMAEGGFEHDSYVTLRARGHALERLDESEIAKRFPAWASDRYPDGFYDPRGGWAESGRVVEALVAEARRAGVRVRANEPVVELAGELDSELDGEGRVTGVRLETDTVLADLTIVAAGAWSAELVPELAPRVRPIAQSIFCFAPDDPAMFRPPAFVPFAADVGRTGWYGFSLHPSGVVKVAHHGPGRAVGAGDPREVPPEAEPLVRSFLRSSIPSLAEAEVAVRRTCLYADSFDGDLFVTRVPGREGLVVASGGSGHAFKLAPVLGPIIADVAEGKPGPARFAWRDPSAHRVEPARATKS